MSALTYINIDGNTVSGSLPVVSIHVCTRNTEEGQGMPAMQPGRFCSSWRSPRLRSKHHVLVLNAWRCAGVERAEPEGHRR